MNLLILLHQWLYTYHIPFFVHVTHIIHLTFHSTTCSSPEQKPNPENDAVYNDRNGFLVEPTSTETTNGFHLGDDLIDLPDALKDTTVQLPTPEALPGDCDVKAYILENIKPYHGSQDFLAPPTERTLEALDEFSTLLEAELANGGVLGENIRKFCHSHYSVR